MSWTITWSAPARRGLTRCPEAVATAVVELVYGPLAENPRRLGKPLTLSLRGLHSARRGDYRVLYRIHDDDHIVEIIAVGHRSDVYRR